MTNHVLYRFFDEAGDLLYVGITNDPGRRFRAHAADKQWWTEVAGSTMEHFADRDELAQAERRVIRQERPRYNICMTRGVEAPGVADSERDRRKTEHVARSMDLCTRCLLVKPEALWYFPHGSVDGHLIYRCKRRHEWSAARNTDDVMFRPPGTLASNLELDDDNWRAVINA